MRMRVSKKLLASASLFLMNSNYYYAAHEFFLTQPTFLLRRVLSSESSLSSNYNSLTAIRKYSGSHDKNYPWNPATGERSIQSPEKMNWREACNKLNQIEFSLNQSRTLFEDMKTLVKSMEPHDSNQRCHSDAQRSEMQSHPVEVDRFYPREIPSRFQEPSSQRDSFLRSEMQSHPVDVDRFYPRKIPTEFQAPPSRDFFSGSETQKTTKSDRGLAVITPVNRQKPFDYSLQFNRKKDLDPLNSSVSNKVLKNIDANLSALTPISLDVTAEDQALSKQVENIRSDFINRIMDLSKDSHKINKKDLISIIDLYTSMIGWQKEGVTKVLNGQVDTNKSVIYNEVVMHVKSKNSNLNAYRDIYMRLSNAFQKEPMQVIYGVVGELNSELNDMVVPSHKTDNIELKVKECVARIVLGANPLYPVQPNEVKSLIELYNTLKNLNKEGITKVLSYQTDTNKSVIYNEVVAHIQSKQMDVETYRNRYLRISKSLSGQALRSIHQLVSISTALNANQNHAANQLTAPQQTSNVSHDQTSNKSQTKNVSTKELPLPHSKNKYPQNLIKTGASQLQLSEKEQMRLTRLYGLLPEYAKRSITFVLSGKTINEDVPVMKDLLEAVDQIKEEVLNDGDKTPIDLKYFKKLYLLSGDDVKIATPRLVDKSSLQTPDGIYSISKKEQDRLNRLYTILHNYPARSITFVLSGKTINEKAPVMKAFNKAMDQIRKEALREGENIPINLKYFRKLHWSLFRITGKAGSQANITPSSKDENEIKNKGSHKTIYSTLKR